MTSSEDKQGGSLGETLKNSSAVQNLGEQATKFLQAKGNDMLGSVTDKLQNAAGNGGLLGTAGAEGAKKMAQGESPMKAAMGGMLSGAKEKVPSALGGGSGKGGGGGSQKAMHIVEDLDVGVPVSVAYDQWTQFQDFSSFMKGVQSVDPSDEVESTWRMKVFKSNRSNTAKISEQIPDHRIAWSSDGSKGSCKGVVTFHPLGDDLTKVLLVLEYYPSGFFEKTANLWRAVGRRARLDLKRYRDHVTINGEASGSWRGEIRDGEVVKQPDEEEESEEETTGEDEDYEPGAEDEDYELDEDEEYEPDVEDEDYEPDEAGYEEEEDEEPEAASAR
jgi:uncharacterized membrane protein